MAPRVTPAAFFASVARAGSVRRSGTILFEIAGPSGGRWVLRPGESVEAVPFAVSCDLLIRLASECFDRFVDGDLDVAHEVESGRLVLAGDLELLDELARAFRAPVSLVELRSGGRQ